MDNKKYKIKDIKEIDNSLYLIKEVILVEEEKLENTADFLLESIINDISNLEEVYENIKQEIKEKEYLKNKLIGIIKQKNKEQQQIIL